MSGAFAVVFLLWWIPWIQRPRDSCCRTRRLQHAVPETGSGDPARDLPDLHRHRRFQIKTTGPAAWLSVNQQEPTASLPPRRKSDSLTFSPARCLPLQWLNLPQTPVLTDRMASGLLNWRPARLGTVCHLTQVPPSGSRPDFSHSGNSAILHIGNGLGMRRCSLLRSLQTPF